MTVHAIYEIVLNNIKLHLGPFHISSGQKARKDNTF